MSRYFFYRLKIDVHATNTGDGMNTFRVSVLDSISTATVHSVNNLQYTPLSSPDAVFGYTENENDSPKEYHVLDYDSSIFVEIRDDFVPEERECFTLQIFPPDASTCNEDEENANDFFCLHTVCIEDDDIKGLLLLLCI